MKKLRLILRRMLYSDAGAYLRYARAWQGSQQAGERENRWYGESLPIQAALVLIVVVGFYFLIAGSR